MPLPLQDNIAYDSGLRHFFFTGYNVTQSRNFLFQWGSAGGAVELVALPGVVEVAESAFAPHYHLMFLVIQERSATGNSLMMVDLLNNTVVSNKNVASLIQLVVVDRRR